MPKDYEMTVQILGSGCAKCMELEKNAREAVAELELNAEVEKVTDSDRIMEMGVMITPALAVDGKVKSSGQILDSAQIKKILIGE
jgi:small redox-active disulfide protein 2